MVTPPRHEQTFGQRLALVPGFIAAAVAALYGIGGLFRASELSHAGYSVRDALPLFPISQLLARGVAAVWSSALAILIFGIYFALMALLARWAQDKYSAVEEVIEQSDAGLAAIRKRLEDEGNPDEELVALHEEFLAFEKSLEGRPSDDYVPEEEVEHFHDLKRRIDAALQRRAEIVQQLDALPDVPAPSDVFGSFGKLAERRFPRWAQVLLLLVPVAMVLMATPAAAVGLWAPWILVTLAVRRGWRIPWYPHYMALLVATFVTAELVASAISPLPLSHVVLRDKAGGRQTGQLIAATGDSWYVGLRKGRVIAIRADDVASAVVTPPSRRHRPKLIIEYITG